jgi:hypothetical protein
MTGASLGCASVPAPELRQARTVSLSGGRGRIRAGEDGAHRRWPPLPTPCAVSRLRELEFLTWGDQDEPRQRWRVSQAASKTGRARWVSNQAGDLRGRVRARAARGPRSRATGLPGLRRRPLPDSADACLHGRGRSGGADRRARRPAEPRGDRAHLQLRARRRGRARLRRAARTGIQTPARQRPNTSASAVSRSRSSLALRRPTDSASLSGLTAVVCSTSTRVDEPWSSIVGRNDRRGAAVDVGDTSTVESASSSSAWTITA